MADEPNATGEVIATPTEAPVPVTPAVPETPVVTETAEEEQTRKDTIARIAAKNLPEDRQPEAPVAEPSTPADDAPPSGDEPSATTETATEAPEAAAAALEALTTRAVTDLDLTREQAGQYDEGQLRDMLATVDRAQVKYLRELRQRTEPQAPKPALAPVAPAALAAAPVPPAIQDLAKLASEVAEDVGDEKLSTLHNGMLTLLEAQQRKLDAIEARDQGSTQASVEARERARDEWFDAQVVGLSKEYHDSFGTESYWDMNPNGKQAQSRKRLGQAFTDLMALAAFKGERLAPEAAFARAIDMEFGGIRRAQITSATERKIAGTLKKRNTTAIARASHATKPPPTPAEADTNRRSTVAARLAAKNRLGGD